MPRGLATRASAWEVALVGTVSSAAASNQLSYTPPRDALLHGKSFLWLNPCSPQEKKKHKFHHSDLTGKAGDLLTQSKLFIFRLIGGGTGYINKKAALSLSKHDACMACIITMTEQFSTQRTEWESTANALCVQHRGMGISLEMLWLQSRTQTRAKHVATETHLLHSASAQGCGFQGKKSNHHSPTQQDPRKAFMTQVFSLAKHMFMEPLAVWSYKLILLASTYTVSSCSAPRQ